VREVEEPDALADRPMLGEHALVLDGHEPAAERPELRAELHVPSLERAVSERVDHASILRSPLGR